MAVSEKRLRSRGSRIGSCLIPFIDLPLRSSCKRDCADFDSGPGETHLAFHSYATPDPEHDGKTQTALLKF